METINLYVYVYVQCVCVFDIFKCIVMFVISHILIFRPVDIRFKGEWSKGQIRVRHIWSKGVQSFMGIDSRLHTY